MTKVLFVCMGNICRSPTAHGLFSALLERSGMADQVAVDSAGTHAYHVGEPPDTRAQQAARSRGIDLGGLRARRVNVADFEEFDYILAMDRSNLEELEARCPPEHGHKLKLFLDFAPHLSIREVPDPYYGGVKGFDRVIDLVEQAAMGLLDDIRARKRT